MELMFELNRERGTTLVLVTHDRASQRALRPAVSHRGGCVAEPGGLMPPATIPG